MQALAATSPAPPFRRPPWSLSPGWWWAGSTPRACSTWQAPKSQLIAWLLLPAVLDGEDCCPGDLEDSLIELKMYQLSSADLNSCSSSTRPV